MKFGIGRKETTVGYLVVPDITNEEIVCQQPCQHRDCLANRAEWTDAKCVTCGKKLKAGMLFYYTSVHSTEHQCIDCAFKEAEARIGR